ncbi:MAG: hypothetical protein ACRC1H_03730 [Caldilineaceae bacterium]
MNRSLRFGSRKRRLAILVACCLLLLPVAAWAAPNALRSLSLPWTYIGGGDQMTGGDYSLQGAVGRSGGDNLVANGGGYSLAGAYTPPLVSEQRTLTSTLFLPIVETD